MCVLGCNFFTRRSSISALSVFLFTGFVILCGCTHLSPLRKNTASNPNASVIDEFGRKLAFIEF
jgi:hypothetical protein